MSWITIVGFMAAALTTFSFLPQAIKTIKSKQTKDLSFGMYLAFTAGVFLWLIYGILIGDAPVIIANSITFILTITILILKIIYK